MLDSDRPQITGPERLSLPPGRFSLPARCGPDSGQQPSCGFGFVHGKIGRDLLRAVCPIMALRALVKAPALHCSGVLRRRGMALARVVGVHSRHKFSRRLGFRNSGSTISRAFDADVIHSLRPR